MTMEQMKKDLENRGFMVAKTYNTTRKGYFFDVYKDGWAASKFFKYPESEPPVEKNRLQCQFIEKIVKEFNGGEKKMNMTDIMALAGNPTGTLEVNGRHFPVVISQVESTSDATGRNETQVTCDVQDVYDSALNKYIKNDAAVTKSLYKHFENASSSMRIQKVVFNNPATIVLWYDGTKTVVKAGKGETYDPEKGLAMAIAKKALGNKGNYYDSIRKWVEEYEDKLIAQAVVENILATAATGDDK